MSAQTSVRMIKIKAGKEPGCVEVGDLNNDKIPDLAIVNQGDSSVIVLLGKGHAQFEAAPGSPFPAGHLPNDLVIADFNADGNQDLAVANHERKFLTVLLGNGKGNFAAAPHSPFPVSGIPHTHGVTTGDFNKDGMPDLATDSWGNDRVEVLFGSRDKLFDSPGVFFKVGKRPYQRLRAGDVNKDGISDIVTTNAESNNVTILLGDGKGGFIEPPGSPFACGDSPFGIAIDDVNADDIPDLAVINSPGSMAEGRGSNGMTVLLGDGSGKFKTMKGSPYDAGRIPNRIATGDVNGDGVNDIVTSDNDTNKIYLFLMDKKGGVLSSFPIIVGNHPKGVAIADLDGDGKGDIVVCNTGDGDVTVVVENNYR